MQAMSKNLFDLSGKVALITGGNSGIGLGFAEGVAKQGADVCIWGRNAEKNAAVVEQLREFGTRVHAVECDVSIEAEVDQFICPDTGNIWAGGQLFRKFGSR